MDKKVINISVSNPYKSVKVTNRKCPVSSITKVIIPQHFSDKEIDLSCPGLVPTSYSKYEFYLISYM